MPFGITPEDPTGTPAEPENGTAFAVTPEIYVPPGAPAEPQNSTTFTPTADTPATGVPGTPPTFIQWQDAGVDLGEPNVLVINFTYPLIATRGVGEHENVITVRRFILPPVLSGDPMQVPVPALESGTLVENPTIFYTSILYPFIFSDAMKVGVPTIPRSFIQVETIEATSVTTPHLQSGTLVASISFLSYGPTIELMDVATPHLQSGTLVVTISFLSYGPTIELMDVATPHLQSGTLVVTINFINYTNWPTEASKVLTPTLQSGTLV